MAMLNNHMVLFIDYSSISLKLVPRQDVIHELF